MEDNSNTGNAKDSSQKDRFRGLSTIQQSIQQDGHGRGWGADNCNKTGSEMGRGKIEEEEIGRKNQSPLHDHEKMISEREA